MTTSQGNGLYRGPDVVLISLFVSICVAIYTMSEISVCKIHELFASIFTS